MINFPFEKPQYHAEDDMREEIASTSTNFKWTAKDITQAAERGALYTLAHCDLQDTCIDGSSDDDDLCLV